MFHCSGVGLQNVRFPGHIDTFLYPFQYVEDIKVETVERGLAPRELHEELFDIFDIFDYKL